MSHREEVPVITDVIEPAGAGLPEAFCWTRFGAEASEQAGSIFERKEAERRCNGAVYLWGIGQSIGPSVPTLLKVAPDPEVLFSASIGGHIRLQPTRITESSKATHLRYRVLTVDGTG